MKKVMMSLVLACTALAAQAESWIMVQESDNGSRLLVDVDSYRNDIKGDDGTQFIGAIFRFFRDGEGRTPFVYVTEAAACKDMTGVLFSRKWENGKWVTVDKYWWSKNGTKMYDSAGELLCGAYNQIKNKSKSGDVVPQKPQGSGKSV